MGSAARASRWLMLAAALAACSQGGSTTASQSNSAPTSTPASVAGASTATSDPAPAPSLAAPTTEVTSAPTVAPTTTEAPEPPPTVSEPTTAAPLPSPRRTDPPVTVARSTGTTVSATSGSSDFWYQLRLCESRDGAMSSNLYQFMGGTGEKMGIDGSEPEWEQTAAAQRWAALIHPNEGTTAGWPECWWVALAATR